MSPSYPVCFMFDLIRHKQGILLFRRLASEGMIFCTRKGTFVHTAEKLHQAFAAIDVEKRREETSTQRSRAVCWGIEEDLGADSDGEEDLDEEAEDLLKFLSKSRSSA